MTAFTPTVLARWNDPFEAGETIFDDGAFRLAVGSSSGPDVRIQILARPARTTALVSAEMAVLHGVREARNVREFRAALSDAGQIMNGADHLFFLSESRKAELRASGNAANVRRLTATDAAVFARFEGSASAQDLDDASVELDHWAVFGAFDGETLVAAGSAYPFEGKHASGLADFGVLTLPEHRGRGHALEIVHAMARHVLDLGFEPQYRCQLDNTGSILLASRAGFIEYGTWDAPRP